MNEEPQLDGLSRIMTKKDFEMIRDNFRGEKDQAKSTINQADSDDVLVLRFVDGSPFMVEKARVISDGKQEYVKALEDTLQGGTSE